MISWNRAIGHGGTQQGSSQSNLGWDGTGHGAVSSKYPHFQRRLRRIAILPFHPSSDWNMAQTTAQVYAVVECWVRYSLMIVVIIMMRCGGVMTNE